MKRLAIAVAIAVFGAAGCGRGSSPSTARDNGGVSATVAHEPRAPVTPSAPLAPPERSASIGFHSGRQLSEHFEKHGSEFGRITRDEYLTRAQQLRDAPAGGTVLETVRRDGVVTRFDRGTGAFIAFDRDGTIRTFFRPNDGESYFRRQAHR